jgi:hypothetical protein
VADREEEGTAPQEEPARPPLDDDAAWAALIAGYDAEPEPGVEPSWPEAENVPPRDGRNDKNSKNGRDITDVGDIGDFGELGDIGDLGDVTDVTDVTDAKDSRDGKDPAAPPPPASRTIVVHPVISGPRNYELAEDDEDEHFVPPEPPPLPDADVTTKFAWIAVIGGPLLLLAFILLQMELTWWVVLVGLGGFLGGFATLVTRMQTDDDDLDDPGRGAVV